jgi:hypothetical protein
MATPTEKRWIIDWRIEGSISIKAETARDAERIFDAEFTYSLHPRCDGELSSDPAYPEEEE